MSVTVRIPTPLQKITNNQSEVDCEAQDIEGMIQQLEVQYPGIKERICDENGVLRRFINVYVNEEDIRFLDGSKTKIKNGDDISIVPAVAGGA